MVNNSIFIFKQALFRTIPDTVSTFWLLKSLFIYFLTVWYQELGFSP